MEFLKKYWYYSVILGLILYILMIPKKVYRVIPKQTVEYKKTIDKLNDSIRILNLQKNELYFNDIVSEKETIKVTVNQPPIEKIVYKNEKIIEEVNCVDYYTDGKRDSLWTGNRIAKKNNSKR